MEKKINVSVVVPVYDVEAYIADCLSSLVPDLDGHGNHLH